MKKQSGFTLVELSMVLVVIGLIVGGVMAGSSLVHQVKLKTIITDVNKYKVAYNTFKMEYNAIPGDMDNATSYWSGTFDGNGNGKIDDSNTTEIIYVWQHLTLAKLIPGSYTGVHEEIGSAMIGKIVPQSGYDSLAGYGMYYSSRNLPYTTGPHSQEARNYLRFGRVYTSGDDRIGKNALTNADALSIDTKMDDGKPGLGLVYARSSGGGTDCHTTTDSATAEYTYLKPV